MSKGPDDNLQVEVLNAHECMPEPYRIDALDVKAEARRERPFAPRFRHPEGFVTQMASSPRGLRHPGGFVTQRASSLRGHCKAHKHAHKHSKAHIPFILKPCNFTNFLEIFAPLGTERLVGQSPRVSKPAGDKARG